MVVFDPDGGCGDGEIVPGCRDFPREIGINWSATCATFGVDVSLVGRLCDGLIISHDGSRGDCEA